MTKITANKESGPDNSTPSPETVAEKISQQKSNTFCIAGIGASAGGLEPICDFFEALPADCNIAFVVVQHLYPNHISLAAEIIAKHTTLSTVAAVDGMRVEANHIYTIPPNTYPSIYKGRLRLEPPKEKKGPRLPIDHFFNSLGKDQHERAIGIIFSGYGTDGSLGIKSIESNGGIVIVQSPETAQADSMPKSAISTGLVNSVLPVNEIPAVLVQYARHDYVRSPSPNPEKLAPGSMEEILALIHSRLGYNFRGYKPNTLMRRIERRMGLKSIYSFGEYCKLLATDQAEINSLLKDMLIGVTDFFRDPEAWNQIRTEVIAPLVASKNSGETIRIWTPGCSTGEEAYTVAILVLEALRESKKHCPLLVFATDTNEDALQFARAAHYPSGISTKIPAEHLQRYFVESSENHHYQINKLLRDSVIFGAQNLLSDPPFSRVDMICCRNLLIYLEPDVQKKIIALFHFSLLPAGYLFLGSAENIATHSDLFSPISKKWRIYRHIGLRPLFNVQAPFAGQTSQPEQTSLPIPVALTPSLSRPSQLARLTQQLIFEHFSPAAVLTNINFETLYFLGPTENYLQMPRGTPTRDLLAQAREGLRSRLRQALREANAKGTTVIVNDARVRREHGFDPIRFSVVPTKEEISGNPKPLFLVVFEERSSRQHETDRSDEPLLQQLEEELRATKDDLRNTIERLETSNEELTISNEEVISVNEELQSINEELESSKEELQSLNEELITVNQQLQSKFEEVEARNTDIENLLASSQISTLCLDHDFRIKWFTPSMQVIASILPGDIGRLISNFSDAGFGANLFEDVHAVLEKTTIRQRELLLQDNHWYLRRVVPYKTEAGNIEGVVLTYTDISEAKKSAKESAIALRAMAASLEERVRERTAQLRTLTSELVLTEERERRALARDLHDDLGQTLAVAKIKISSMYQTKTHRVSEDSLIEKLHEIETLIDQANRSIRSAMLQLSPPTLEALGLVSALGWLSEEIERKYGLVVRLNAADEIPEIEEPARTTIFRSVRELLINVAKHADTDVATVDCQKGEDGRILISVTDQGLGFDYQTSMISTAGAPGFGLISVRERIEFIGGEMTVKTMPGYGTQITIIFPARDERDLEEGKGKNDNPSNDGR